MKFIYFHIDERDRDLTVARDLSRMFKEKNVKVFFGTRKTHKILKFFAWIFDIIIFPRPHFLDYFGNNINNWKSKIVCLPTENIGALTINKSMFVKSTMENDFFSSTKKKRVPDLQFVWGPKQLKYIEDFLPSESKRFFVSGHPRYNSLGNIKLKTHLKKPDIILLSRANSLNDYLLRNPLIFLLDGSHNYSKKVFGDIAHPLNCIDKSDSQFIGKTMSAQVIDFISFMNIIKLITKNRDKFGKVIIRSHPKENINFYRKIIKIYGNSLLLDDLSISLIETLKNFDFCISPPSTSFYDCIRVGCTPVSTEFMSKDRPNFNGLWSENNNELNKIIKKPKTLNDMLSILLDQKNEINLKKVEKIFKDECNYPEDQNSISNIVNLLYDKYLYNESLSFKKIIMYKLIVIIKFLFVKLYFQFKEKSSASDIIIEKTEF